MGDRAFDYGGETQMSFATINNRSMKMARDPKDIADRFWAKVDKDGPIVRSELGPCWIWTSGKAGKYGIFGVVGIRKGQVYSHRYSWMMKNGQIPIGMFILHRCDNPPCVRPEHLFLGTPADNMADMRAKGRDSKGDVLAHHGSDHGYSKLTNDQIREIRLAASVGAKHRTQGRLYGVSGTNIRMIVNNQTWQHII